MHVTLQTHPESDHGNENVLAFMYKHYFFRLYENPNIEADSSTVIRILHVVNHVQKESREKLVSRMTYLPSVSSGMLYSIIILE